MKTKKRGILCEQSNYLCIVDCHRMLDAFAVAGVLAIRDDYMRLVRKDKRENGCNCFSPAPYAVEALMGPVEMRWISRRAGRKSAVVRRFYAALLKAVRKDMKLQVKGVGHAYDFVLARMMKMETLALDCGKIK